LLTANPFTMATLVARVRSELARWQDNPILRYEGALRPVHRWTTLGQVVAGALLLSLLLSGALLLVYFSPRTALSVYCGVAVLWAIVSCISGALQMARVIPLARQLGTWDDLIVSPLRPVDIVVGKLASILIPVWASWLFLAPPLLIVVAGADATQADAFGRVSTTVGHALVASISFTIIALFWSLVSVTPMGAQLATLATMLVTYSVASFAQWVWFLLLLGAEGGGDYELSGASGWAWATGIALPGAVALLALLLRFPALHRIRRRGR
jgi:hypothetical protein